MLENACCYLYLYEYVEDTNTGVNSTGERAHIDGVGEQIWSSQRR
jgi:hypothetical protein